MGTVHARSLEPLPASGPDFGGLGEEAEFVEVEPEAKQEILENKDVVVQHVHFDGLGRTKDDIIMCEIGDVFKAKNLIEVMRKSHEAREKLLRLGIFRQVDVLIDTCQGDDALPNGLDVTFEVTELRRLTGSYNTMVGNNEGSMVLGLKLPNLLGRAEKVTFQFSYGTKETSYGLSFFKPQPGNFERNFSVNLYKVTGQFPWSSCARQTEGCRPSTVSRVEEQPHRQVGGRVARAGLPVPDRVVRRPQGERALAQVVSLARDGPRLSELLHLTAKGRSAQS